MFQNSDCTIAALMKSLTVSYVFKIFILFRKKFTSNFLACFCIIVTFLLVNFIVSAVVYNLYSSPTINQPAAANSDDMFNHGRYSRELVIDNTHKKSPENHNSQLQEAGDNGFTNNFSSNDNIIEDKHLSLGKDAMSTVSHGYVLPYRLYEQQTAAARNLWGLQYWANTVGMKVVEPFFMKYAMSFEPMVVGMSNPPRFSDLYDREFWNEQSTKRKCSELVTWEDFITHAPRQTILVVVTTPKPNRRSEVNDTLINVINYPKSNTSSQECVGIDFTSEAMSYFSKEGFQYVRKVCITFACSSPMDVTTFSNHILGPYHPKTVTIMFSYWKGIRSRRVNLKDVELSNDNTVALGLLPSKKTVKESEQYLEKLKLDNRVKYNGGKYFGVMVRLEKVYLRFVEFHSYSSTKFWNHLIECANTMTSLKEFRVYKSWGRLFAIDAGVFGSQSM